MPSEHSIDGVRAVAESQYRFVVDKNYKHMTDTHEIILSTLVDLQTKSTTKGFFRRLLDKLKTIPVTEMLETNEANSRTIVMDTPINLNTFYRRPICFWLTMEHTLTGTVLRKSYASFSNR